MLEYTIGGETYQFNAGFGFLREADSLRIGEDGKPNGVLWCMAGIMDREPERLRDTLLAMNKGLTPRIDAGKLEKWLESHENIEGVYEDVVRFFEGANCTRTKWQKMQTFLQLASAAKQ